MKKFFRIFSVAALACATFVACEEKFDDYTPAEPQGDNYGVHFLESATSFELDPADPTTLTFPVARTNTADAITVPVTVTLGGEVFTAEPIVFAAGQAESTMTVNFPNAEVGVSYEVGISINDPDYIYTSIWGAGSTGRSFTLSRVKWNMLGTGVFTYNFWWVGTDSAQTLEQRDGTNIYRMKNWGGGVTLFFEMVNGKPVISKQLIGDVHPSYGDVYVHSSDGAYDPSTKTYLFLNNYTVSAGSFGGDVESFQLTNPVE